MFYQFFWYFGSFYAPNPYFEIPQIISMAKGKGKGRGDDEGNSCGNCCCCVCCCLITPFIIFIVGVFILLAGNTRVERIIE